MVNLSNLSCGTAFLGSTRGTMEEGGIISNILMGMTGMREQNESGKTETFCSILQFSWDCRTHGQAVSINCESNKVNRNAVLTCL